MPSSRKEAVELKEACVRAAHEVIAERGIEHLSLRDVARRLGVSHQAPYKHYPSRDHLLAEVIRRCFEGFARYLDARPAQPDPRQDLESLGKRYLAYAQAHPLEYRLMFGTPWPEPAAHPDLVRDAVHAFDVLRSVLQRLRGEGSDQADLDAMYIWSSMHGLASILQSNVMEHLHLHPRDAKDVGRHVMEMMSRALDAHPGAKAR
jgi:AcrR family transcriptional regulator